MTTAVITAIRDSDDLAAVLNAPPLTPEDDDAEIERQIYGTD